MYNWMILWDSLFDATVTIQVNLQFSDRASCTKNKCKHSESNKEIKKNGQNKLRKTEQ